MKGAPRSLIVTGSDSSHFRSLINLLRSITFFEPDRQVEVFNLGMTPSEVSEIAEISTLINVVNFEFENYPGFFNIRSSAGEYAWKPEIIWSVFKNASKNVIWMDAGNLVTGKLRLVDQVIYSDNIFILYSTGTLRQWTFPSTLDQMEVPKHFLDLPQHSAACIGFKRESRSAVPLLETWKNLAHQKNVIAPVGSNRTNHRQDQSLISILIYQDKYLRRKITSRLRIRFSQKDLGFKIQQDVD
jgi:hypothetical protein